MRTHQLEQALQTHKLTRNIFKGVFASNKLPKYISRNKHTCFIANTDPHHKAGQHWVAYYYTKTHVYFFDSYGRPPWKPPFERLMKHRKYKKYFSKRIQGNGYVCGYYCLFFILGMIKDWDFNKFGNDLNANDVYVRKIVTRHFPNLD